jgi:signal transduction histidine kinase
MGQRRLVSADVLIGRALVFLMLAGFVAAVYAAVVVGIGTVLGRGQPDLVLAIVATGIVAVAFDRVQNSSQRFVGRLVHGQRASPYEVLLRFSGQVARVYASDEVLARMAKVVADGTGATSTQVWLCVGETLQLAASWPDPPADVTQVLLIEAGLPQIAGVDALVAVHHHGELLGALAVAKPPGEPLTPLEAKLLGDLAAQAGLVFRNVGLTAQLQARLAELSARASELRASRARIVAAQDAERRWLERNIHDSAQQHLVALAVKLQLTRTFAARAPDRARQLLGELQAATTATQATLSTLARGIYPAVLTEQGLVAALRAHAGGAPVPVEITATHVGRHDQELEAAVYFCCLEALQNVVKHAAATTALVRLEEDRSQLHFSVTDDGGGFELDVTPRGSGLQNMADRVEALGGRLQVHSVAGGGTTVTGLVPVRRTEPAG